MDFSRESEPDGSMDFGSETGQPESGEFSPDEDMDLWIETGKAESAEFRPDKADLAMLDREDMEVKRVESIVMQEFTNYMTSISFTNQHFHGLNWRIRKVSN